MTTPEHKKAHEIIKAVITKNAEARERREKNMDVLLNSLEMLCDLYPAFTFSRKGFTIKVYHKFWLFSLFIKTVKIKVIDHEEIAPGFSIGGPYEYDDFIWRESSLSRIVEMLTEKMESFK